MTQLGGHVYEAPPVVVSAALHQRLVTLAHHPQYFEHPGGGKLYGALLQGCYWPTMGPARDGPSLLPYRAGMNQLRP